MSSCSPAITRPYPQFADRVAPFGFGELFSRGLCSANTGQFTLIEKLCDDRRIAFSLKDAHYVTFGPEPIAAFYLAKKAKAKTRICG